MISIFKTSQDFEAAIDKINTDLFKDSAAVKTTMLLTNKLTMENRKSGFWNGLKVKLLSILRIVGYDQFSYVRINNVAKALLAEVDAHCKNGTMNHDMMIKLKRTTHLLGSKSAWKYNVLMTKTYNSMLAMYELSKKNATEKATQEKSVADWHDNMKIEFDNTKLGQAQKGLHYAGEGLNHVQNYFGGIWNHFADALKD